MKKFNPKLLSILDLLQHFSTVLDELKRRGVVRTRNNPTGGYAEWLVSKKLKLKLAPNSNAGYDAKDRWYRRYQIKATRSEKYTQLSVIRNLKEKKFVFLIAVHFHNNFTVRRAFRISHTTVSKYAYFVKTLNGHILQLHGPILKDRGVKEITEMLK